MRSISKFRGQILAGPSARSGWPFVPQPAFTYIVDGTLIGKPIFSGLSCPLRKASCGFWYTTEVQA